MGSKQTLAGAVAGKGAFAVGIANKLGRFGFGQLASPPGRIRGQPDVDDYKIPAGRAVAIM
jgi:hypothetical protein